MLVAATLIWGGSFVVTRQAVQGVAPLVFVGVRFAVAAILVALATRPALHRMTRTELRGGLAIGAAMVGGYGLQAVGMHMGVPSGRAAFISALYVPMVPLLQMIILRRRPAGRVWAALALAFAGLILLAGPLTGDATSGTVVRGELLVLGGAFAIAAEILLVGVFAPQVDPRRLAVVECVFVAFACLGAGVLFEPAWPHAATGWLAAAALLGLASAGLQIAVNWAQRFVPPARATLIYTLEPVWAALFGTLAGERMGPAALAGAATILASLLVGNL